jgi:hypothetical protein
VLTRTTAALAAVLALAGCAGTEVVSLGDDKARDEAARGIRYWQPAPFLFVRSDGQGGIAADIKWLPDTTQKMSIRPYSCAALNTTDLVFTDGVLTSTTVTIDETVVVSASIDALGKAFTAAAKGNLDAGPAAAPNTVPNPLVYKIVIKGNQIALIGGEARGPDGAPAVIYATLPSKPVGEQK